MLGFNSKNICIYKFLVIGLLTLDTVFDTLLQDNFTPATKSEINKITKKKLSMVKTLIKFLYIFKK